MRIPSLNLIPDRRCDAAIRADGLTPSQLPEYPPSQPEYPIESVAAVHCGDCYRFCGDDLQCVERCKEERCRWG
jgi:hypothetical protein